MKDTVYIKSTLDNLLANTPLETNPAIEVFNGKVQILSWIMNQGNLRTEQEMNVKIRNTEEEIMAFQFMNMDEREIPYQKAKAKLAILKDILE